MNTWLILWQLARSAEESWMLYLVSVEDIPSISFFTSNMRWCVSNMGSGNGCSLNSRSKVLRGAMDTWIRIWPSLPSKSNEDST